MNIEKLRLDNKNIEYLSRKELVDTISEGVFKGFWFNLFIILIIILIFIFLILTFGDNFL
jgi:hypothetical protein